MTYKKLLTVITAFFVGFGLAMADVEAARLGSSKDLGRTSPSYSKQTTPNTSPNTSPSSATTPTRPYPGTTTAPAPARSGASRWLGPLAGLAAGGLLAAMFFGDGFQSLQLFDIVILLAIGVGIWLVVRMMRSRSPVQPAHHYAGANFTPDADQGDRFVAPEIGSALGRGHPINSDQLSWFNEDNFMQNARTHYLGLQKAWDAGDMGEIREYVTPELFRELSRERAALGNGPNVTEVLQLDLEFLGLATEGDLVIAGVRYSGYIREDQGGQAKPFRETWHIQRSLQEPNANWYLAGIQQN